MSRSQFSWSEFNKRNHVYAEVKFGAAGFPFLQDSSIGISTVTSPAAGQLTCTFVDPHTKILMLSSCWKSVDDLLTTGVAMLSASAGLSGSYDTDNKIQKVSMIRTDTGGVCVPVSGSSLLVDFLFQD